MKRITIYLFLIVFILANCDTDKNPIISENYSPFENLYEAFNSDSLAQLEDFYIKWEETFKPYSENELNKMSDTLKTVMDVFCSFYRPDSLSGLGYGTSEDDYLRYNGIKYTIIQNYVTYAVIDSFDTEAYAFEMEYPPNPKRTNISNFSQKHLTYNEFIQFK